MISFDKIVKKLYKNEWKIFDIYDIWKIIDPDFSPDDKKNINKIYKIIYLLKSNWVIFPIKNSLFFINSPLSKKIDEQEIIDNNYWKILKKIISQNTPFYFIGWDKSLEIITKDYSLPEEITIYTKELDKKIKISSNHTVIFKTIKSGKKTDNKNIFNKLAHYSQNVVIDEINLKTANKELALLESLTIKKIDWINEYLVNKFIKKYGKSLDFSIIWDLVEYKYITSINRLRKIAQEWWMDDIYENSLKVIKNNWWGCFISVN